MSVNGWTWSPEAGCWTARRGSALITVDCPYSEPPHQAAHIFDVRLAEPRTHDGVSAEIIREIAGHLFDEQIAASWTDRDRDSFNGWSIRQAVLAIAAGGEEAGLGQILAGCNSWPGSDLPGRCMTVIEQARQQAAARTPVPSTAPASPQEMP